MSTYPQEYARCLKRTAVTERTTLVACHPNRSGFMQSSSAATFAKEVEARLVRFLSKYTPVDNFVSFTADQPYYGTLIKTAVHCKLDREEAGRQVWECQAFCGDGDFWMEVVF